MVRSMVGTDEFLEIFVDTPLDVLEARDPKGLYAKARVGKITNFTGIDAPYEVPTNPDLRIDTTTSTVDVSAEAIVDVLTSRRIIDT
jgi:bifunctional enzyme CysN/CysC